ncbi:hypothetical protein [Brevibacterium marinum]|uniref:Uncharacterized protein n=1 Tax=Brevibacterium marinum TaxID=418643 RepID=A0A846S0Z1_9MICO|nr:hypothetical protein [Brevibacterium marinum]NJC56738.1 hypothetical protein [Brevibacterium marinum]
MHSQRHGPPMPPSPRAAAQPPRALTADSRHRRSRRGRKGKQPLSRRLTSSKPPRTLGADICRILIGGMVAVAVTMLMMWGWAEQVIGAGRPSRPLDAEGTGIYGTLAIAFVALLFPLLPASPRRVDFGYRHRGLLPLFLLGSMLVAGLMALSTLLWPILLGPLAPTKLYFAWGTSALMVTIAFFLSWTLSLLCINFIYPLIRWSESKWNNRLTGGLLALVVVTLMLLTLPLLDMPVAQAPLALLILIVGWAVFVGLTALIVGLGQATRKSPAGTPC